MLIGYARNSTVQQQYGFEAQVAALQKIGCNLIYQEQVSAVGKREQLDKALAALNAGDVFVATKLDRIARSVMHLQEIVQTIDKKKASLRVLDINLDTGTPTGKLMLNMLSCISQFERELMLERQKVGVQAAKAAGKYKGRAPTARAKTDDVLRFAKKGLTKQEIAHQLNIGVASVYRILAHEKIAA